MAMRPTRGGGVGSNRPYRPPPRAGVRPVYEDFRPVSERVQEEEAEKLLIYLPGFKKENIRVSTEGKNTVRVRGERLVAGNKWNRFQEDFQAPEDCNMRGIHAKFENGILTITMPWKIPKQLLDEPIKQTTPPPPPKYDDFPPKTTYTSPTIEPPRKPTPLKPTAQLPKPLDGDKDQDSGRVLKEKQGAEKKLLEGQLGSVAESSKTEKGTNENLDFPPLKATPLGKTSGEKEKPREDKKILEGQLGSVAESSKTQKGHENLGLPPLKATPLGETSSQKGKPRDEKKILDGLLGIIEPKILKSKEEDKLDQNNTHLVKSGKEVEKEKTKAEGKKDTEKSKESKGEFQEKVEHKGSQEKTSTSDVAAGASSYPAGEFSVSNLMKNLGELNEERQLLVNSGVAVLVIMALGAYVYHYIGSGRAD